LSVFDEFEDATVGLLCVVEHVEVLGWRMLEYARIEPDPRTIESTRNVGAEE
jgi:hypothetical protein